MNTWIKNGFSISTNKDYLDIDAIHKFLSEEAYWALGRPKETIKKSIDNTTLCFGVYKGDVSKGDVEQVGFARVVSDLTIFAYLADVFIVPEYRKLGLSKWLMEVITNHPDLQNVRRFMLVTNDAHTLYSQFGFKAIDHPERFMEKFRG
ncbi:MULTISPECIES: GNAT family N-acetyltransferase [Neobacillus]|uniref:GNAT family N-acetyltransferase n=1 Tax=Neobacillus rhizophilus TaxID=2833579 RepID=A0A942U3C6_9BACI|nr:MULTISPECIES: GNAT family N-acetyltransferase [Neobacillus]MBS4213906.1 GNAT family N-acetyltransferase [Neobacillus rhizophilus]MBU8917690.1 GNAT family N-acetyltransferase [Bacillus sp. FJAT-29953]